MKEPEAMPPAPFLRWDRRLSVQMKTRKPLRLNPASNFKNMPPASPAFPQAKKGNYPRKFAGSKKRGIFLLHFMRRRGIILI